jgi:hypothetical protein
MARVLPLPAWGFRPGGGAAPMEIKGVDGWRASAHTIIFGQDCAGSWYDLTQGCEPYINGSRSPKVATMRAETVSRPWRRFLRFSVRGLIVVVLMAGVWLGWIVESARTQRETVAAIKSAGGAVCYDW